MAAADEGGVAASSSDEVVGDGDGGVRVDGGGNEVAEGLPGEFVGSVQDLAGYPGGGDVELVGEGPDVVRVGGDQTLGWGCRDAQTVLVVPVCAKNVVRPFGLDECLEKSGAFGGRSGCKYENPTVATIDSAVVVP